MKVIKLASGKKKLCLSRKEWEKIGREAGWGDVIKSLIVDPLVNTVGKAFEPEYTSPRGHLDEDSGKAYELGGQLNEYKVKNVRATEVDMADVEKKANAFLSADADVLRAFNRAIKFVKTPPNGVSEKTINGMKVLLYRVLNLKPKSKDQLIHLEMLKKWNKQKEESDALWEKPKNPYL